MSKKLVTKGGSGKRGCREDPCATEQISKSARITRSVAKSRNDNTSTFYSEYSRGLKICEKKRVNYNVLIQAYNKWYDIVNKAYNSSSSIIAEYCKAKKRKVPTLATLAVIEKDDIKVQNACALAALLTDAYGRDFIINYYNAILLEESQLSKDNVDDIADDLSNILATIFYDAMETSSDNIINKVETCSKLGSVFEQQLNEEISIFKNGNDQKEAVAKAKAAKKEAFFAVLVEQTNINMKTLIDEMNTKYILRIPDLLQEHDAYVKYYNMFYKGNKENLFKINDNSLS